MFCSTVIPTIGRVTLAHAVGSVLTQQFTADDFEVIVVNDSGSLLRPEPWQSSERVRVVDTYRHERSVARNTGAALARGRYFHFLDDDDLLLPGALQAFWELAQARDAVWLHGHYQPVDNEGRVLGEYDPEMEGDIFALLVAGEAIPFQASLIRSNAFFAAGCFDPRITGPEDRDLARRIALRGHTAGTSAVVAQIRVGQAGSTTDWGTLPERDRLGRESALREPGAYTRLRESANTSHLRGRASRACLASAAWNLRHRRPAIAGSRAMECLALTSWHVFSPDYWRGLRASIANAASPGPPPTHLPC